MTPDQIVREFVTTYAAPDADVVQLLCQRHDPDRVAFTVIDADLTSRDVTYGELDESSMRLAAALAARGVGVGDRVGTLLGKSVELLVSVLAIWRLGAVQVPLFTAFAPPAIAYRIREAGITAVVVDPGQRGKLDPSDELPAERDWFVVNTGAPGGDDLSFGELLAERHGPVAGVAVGGDGVLVELFTSGTTGTPKGVPIPVRGLAQMAAYQRLGLDHTAADVFWNAADSGWAYGLYYAILGPMALGHRALLLSAGFTPELTWQVLERFAVTNFAAGPTVYRALRNTDTPTPSGLRLRHCSSAGEPLPPDVITWAEQEFGVPVLDHYGQTETGMTVANSWHPELRDDLKPGSMGKALPGWQVEVLHPDRDEPVATGDSGRVAVDVPNSPLMAFSGYRSGADRFSSDGRWYFTGDVATRDSDGYLSFGARDDDVILMAGYRIGPFEVESALLAHDAVAEAAVVGAPDELRGEIVVAYVVATQGVAPDAALAAELKDTVKQRLAAHAYPREVHFVDEIPKTPSGKIQRFLLRQ